jgi:type 1 glutamine amidotransferase
MLRKSASVVTFAVLTALAAFQNSAPAAPRKAPVGEAEIAKINKAIPDGAPAKPKQPRKVLIYTRATGYYHASIPLGAKAFELMGERTGAFTAVDSDDPASFEPSKLKDFDAIVMMSTTGELFTEKGADTAGLRASLLNFVRSGKGIVGVHAACDCSYQWPDYGDMMGGYFNGHPWGPVVIRIDEPSNPVNAAFGGKPFAIREEMYTFKAPWSRDKLRVLTSIDLGASKIDRGLNRPNDQDYAVSWIKRYGEGRVFYCSLGHGDGTYYQPTVMAHFLAGIQFALGDLDADASPSGPLSPERLAENKRVGDAGFQRVGSHDAWYRTRKDVAETTFSGKLTREATTASSSSTVPATDKTKAIPAPSYLLDGVPVVTGAATHPQLEGWVGQRVEILGRLIESSNAGKQIWAAEARPAQK